VALRGLTYQVYTHSYLGLGQDEARETVATAACFIEGYPIPSGYAVPAGTLGTGDWAACREAIVAAVEKPCAEEPCSLFGVYQPPLYGDFLAFSVYAYASDFFGLRGSLSPARIEAAGTEHCAQSWLQLVADDPSVEENPFLPTYCFASAYIATLLSDVFDFADDTERVSAPLRVQGIDVGWALGALLNEIAGSDG
jgi:adenosinetriphosphatase